MNESSNGIGFGRSNVQFFHEAETQEAVVALAETEGLVLYCGAGVTIDRTGMSWGGLISELIRSEGRTEKGMGNGPSSNLTQHEIALLESRMTPLQLATVFSEMRQEHTGDKQKAVVSAATRIHELLYDSNGWQAGSLVRSTMKLAMGFMILGRRVTIVTSNYDDYLEVEYDYSCRRLEHALREAGEGPPELPGLVARSVGRRGTLADRRRSAKLGQIELIYLHGRISHKGKIATPLVLDELDYHTSHDVVQSELTHLFRAKNTGLLVMGSSLTDPPLLAALSATRHLGNRFALFPAQATGMVDADPSTFARLRAQVTRRARHFGVQLLVPDFHFQIAQFCLEVWTALVLPEGPRAYLNDHREVRYGQRLLAWWERWSSSVRTRDDEAIYKELTDGLRRVMTLLRASGRDAGGGEEHYKLELWVRHAPRDRRQLGLWASTAGVLRDRRLMRTAEISLNSTNASVRALLEGQAQFATLSALGPIQSETTRWRSFLSVPIRIESPLRPDGTIDDRDAVDLLTGVVTLCSMKDGALSSIPLGETSKMEHVVGQLTALGISLLQA